MKLFNKKNRRTLRNLKFRIHKTNKELIAERKKSEPSEGEAEIMQVLKKNEIKFYRESYMNGLYNPATLKPLFFDFYLPDYNAAIEFDGIYHFKPIKGEAAFIKQKQRDQIKNDFCRTKDIKLLRIPYWTRSIEKDIFRFFDKYFPIQHNGNNRL